MRRTGIIRHEIITSIVAKILLLGVIPRPDDPMGSPTRGERKVILSYYNLDSRSISLPRLITFNFHYLVANSRANVHTTLAGSSQLGSTALPSCLAMQVVLVK